MLRLEAAWTHCLLRHAVDADDLLAIDAQALLFLVVGVAWVLHHTAVNAEVLRDQLQLLLTSYTRAADPLGEVALRS